MDERDRYLTIIRELSQARQALGGQDLSGAVVAAQAVLALAHDNIEALSILAAAARGLGQINLEVSALEQLVQVAPFMASALNDLGRVRLGQGDAASAYDLFQSAIDLEPGNPPVWHNLARAAMACDRPAKACLALALVLAHDPARLDALTDLAAAAREAAFFITAEKSIARCLRISPGNSGAIWNRALLRLLTGDLPGGFEDYEARWDQPENAKYRRHLNLPIWAGQSLVGKTLLIWAEQGLGDAIQFVRYVQLVAALGGQIVLEAPRSLHALFESVGPHMALVVPGGHTHHADFACPLGSLPRAFGFLIPDQTPYLAVGVDRIDHWHQWLDQKIGDQQCRIGLVWQGNPTGSIDRGRSVPLKALGPLIKDPGFAWIVLQKRYGLDQIDASGFGDQLIRPPDGFDDGAGAFMDSAALIQSLDLVITSDTSMAHLAGALGRPCLVMLKSVPDWRWQLAQSTTPWYPSLTLVRQPAHGDWPGVVDQIVPFLKGQA